MSELLERESELAEKTPGAGDLGFHVLGIWGGSGLLLVDLGFDAVLIFCFFLTLALSLRSQEICMEC